MKPHREKWWVTLFCLPLGLLAANALGQDKPFPNRPVEMIVNFGTGGGADQLGRTMAKLLEPILGVPVAVSNVAGASGNAGLTKVLTNPPDGYTIGTLTGISVSSWAGGLGRLTVGDFVYLAVVQSSPSMLFVPANSPHKGYRELLDAAKAHPDKLRVVTAGYGTLDDIAVRYLASQGFPMVNVPLAKPGERYMSPLGGHSEVLFEEPGDVVQFIQSKQYRPVVVFGSQRHPEFPDVPASAEFGHAIDLPNWRAIVASNKVPKAQIDILSNAIDKAMETPDWRKFCAETYTCIPKKGPEEGRRFAQKNYDDVAKFMKEFKITVK